VKVRGEGAAWFDPVAATTSFQVDNGKITSADGRIDCGIVDGVRTSLCTADFPWDGTPVVLTATGSTGFGYHRFAGSCSGNGDCSLSGNADKMVLVRFATSASGLGGHPNFSDQAIHGPEYANYVAGGPGALDCAQCHGADLQGSGIALSCATCHPAPAPGPGGSVALTREEQCSGCHAGQGAAHQTAYNRYTDASDLVIAIATVASVDPDLDGTYTSTMTVDITKGGAPYTGTIAALPQKTFYAVTYNAGKFDTTVNYNANTAAAVAGTPGRFTVTSSAQTNGSTGANVTGPLQFRPEDGPSVAFAYVTDTAMTFEAFTVYDNVGHDGQEFGTVDYVSPANDAGCQKCHGTPYMKHGYRVAHTADLDDFAACKICHYDTRQGGHQGWQLLVDDVAAYANQAGVLTNPQKAQYAYKASVMNDVHMSHAMEFAYPQSMANCVTCHEGKLNAILSDADFTLATCKSCHPIKGVGGTDAKRAPALGTLMADSAFDHAAAGMDPDSLYTVFTGNCNGCHNASGAPSFSEIHTGYNRVIYADETTRYSDAFTFAITDATVDAENVLTFTATLTENVDIAGLSVENVVPTAYVAPYGFDTKHFIQASKNTNLNAPATGWTVVVTSTASTKTWEVSLDLDFVGSTAWSTRIANGTIKRVELGVRPQLQRTFPGDTAATTLALNFATRTFDLVGNDFGASTAIVDANKCNKCHDALGTTFHSPDRGGNVVGCRICHVTLNGGSHLEMQSRSIDSYIHAIHSMQPFDSGDVDFVSTVAAMKYDHHIESTYPNFSIQNCESCHNPGTYEVPTHAGSLPGLLSASDVWDTPVGSRTIGSVPSVVTGPAARACGSCHRAHMINEDLAEDLAAFDAHTAAFGYRDAPGSTTTLEAVIAKIQEYIDALLP
jgi:OmcA/MtrC family decaheme c-type cytochrome